MIRFLADASLRGAIVRGCRRREPAMDFLSAHDANLAGVPDPDVLALATEQGRILVSHDFQTMPQHFADLVQALGTSSGLIIVPQYMRVGRAVDELVLIWGASEADEWTSRIAWLPLL
jgi:hypothetical protein